MKESKFPGGLLERVWFVSLITGIVLKAFDLIGWIAFILIITIWPVVVVALIILGIVVWYKYGIWLKKGEENDPKL